MEALPPGIRFRIRDLFARLPARERAGRFAHRDLRQLLDQAEPWLAADPALAELGYWLIGGDRSIEVRRLGCRWLASFPSPTTIERLAALAIDPLTPEPVREGAIWALGHRQVRARHRSLWWSPAAISRADDALVGLADIATQSGNVCSTELPEALCHLQCDAASAILARAPGLWGSALECFGSPALARVLLVCLGDIPARHRLRALQLSAAVLGQEAVPMLSAHASQSPLDDKLEIALLMVAVAGEAKLGVLEQLLKDMPNAAHYRQRARWHVQNPGIVPIVRGLRVARSTAAMPAADRSDRCSRAADDFSAACRFARRAEPRVYRLWAWMVRGANDPARAGELVAADPHAQYDVGPLYLEELARRGQVRQLIATAHALDETGRGAMYLAMWGKPLAALELASTTQRRTPEVVVARCLACYRAGRPDLAQRILDHDVPAPAPVGGEMQAFPGPHERWLVEHTPETQPALAALMAGLPGVIGHAKPAPFDGDPDSSLLAPVAELAQQFSETHNTSGTVL